jgi:hypothetical protein
MDSSKLGDQVQGVITDIGQAFFFASYLPALLFVALHQYALLPALGLSGTLLPDVPEVPFLSGELLTTLLLPLFLAMLLVSLNTAITRFFEGLFPWQRSFLLRRWQRANERKSQQLYGELQKWKVCYRSLLEAIAEAEESSEASQSSRYWALIKRFWPGERFSKWLAPAVDTPEDVPDTSPKEQLSYMDLIAQEIQKISPEEQFDCWDLITEIMQAKSPEALFDCLYQIAEKIQEIHEQIEENQPVQPLPFQASFARPTTLGNAFAVFEEYPLDRYGIDGVLFWPRLRQVVDDKLLSVLDNLKMFLDFQLHLSALALIFTVEAAATGIVSQTAGWWIAAGLALLVARLAYSAGIRVVRTIGTLVSTCFDLYRGKLLKQFGLTQSTNFFEEYKTWLQLSAFLRRGELFYWPGDL